MVPASLWQVIVSQLGLKFQCPQWWIVLHRWFQMLETVDLFINCLVWVLCPKTLKSLPAVVGCCFRTSDLKCWELLICLFINCLFWVLCPKMLNLKCCCLLLVVAQTCLWVEQCSRRQWLLFLYSCTSMFLLWIQQLLFFSHAWKDKSSIKQPPPPPQAYTHTPTVSVSTISSLFGLKKDFVANKVFQAKIFYSYVH